MFPTKSLSNFFKSYSKRIQFLVVFLIGIVLLIVIKSDVIAQVTDIFIQDGDTVSSPSKLKQKPPKVEKEANRRRQDTVNMSSAEANPEEQNIPEHIIYSQIFRHIQELNRKADDEESKGKDGSRFRKLYKQMAKLDDKESKALDKITKKTNLEIEKLDKKARKIIEKLRAETPDGKLEFGQLPPAPPAELLELSNQRKQLIMQAITELRTDFGEDGFAKFKDFVEKKVKPGIRRMK
ncbi:MAG: hypothetical protein ACR2J3_07025 [Aridibacter sp.]